MTTFRFDEDSDFEANVEAFLTYMSTEDSEMTAILCDHISKLKGATDDTKRSAARSIFNAGVKDSLNSLLRDSEEGPEE